MAEDETAVYLLIVLLVVAVLGLGLAAASFVTNESFGRMMGGAGGGGMMGNPGGGTGTATPGGIEWAILIVSVALLALAVVLLIRSRRPGVRAEPVTTPAVPAVPDVRPAIGHTDAAGPSAAAVQEPALVKLLDQDEKRMYLELRDHGGEMYQRDIVALGTFSKAKVTRVLDKLEGKGLVVREAHGMTNRVRLTNLPAK